MEAQKLTIAALIAPHVPLELEAIAAQVVPCKRPEHGDYSFPCFALTRGHAERFGRNPAAAAKELATTLADCREAQVSALGPYLNFRLDQSQLSAQVLRAVFEDPGYGGSDRGHGKRIVIDYSSPNIAKPFGIGHLRSTIIGAALKRLYEHHGYEVIGVNHIGDWGTQFGLMIAAWKRWADEIDRDGDMVEQFYTLYVRINALAKQDPEVHEEGRAWFRKLEADDPEALELWRYFRDSSLGEFEKIYALLGVSFEAVTGESFYNDKMESVLNALADKGLSERSQGALIVNLDARVKEGLGKVLLRKDDGATLYATRDLSAALYRQDTYQPERLLYVVGLPQKQHFSQLFETLKLLGAPCAERAEHVGFGHYLGMSSRKGTLVFLKEVLERTSAMAAEIAAGLRTREQISLSSEETAEVGRRVGIGAVLFFDFKSRRARDLEFDWDRMLNLKGDTGPYVQWTYARCCGILRKHARETRADVDFALLDGEQARELVKQLGRFPKEVERALTEHEPSYIASYLIDLAKATNGFVHVSNVIHSEDALRDARALAVDAARRVLGQGLGLLGITALEKM